MTSTNELENAVAFTKADSHGGGVRMVFMQAKSACRTLLNEVERLNRKLAHACDEGKRLTAEIERLKNQKILRQSQVYHAMRLVDRVLRRQTCDETFMADVDEAMRIVNAHLRLNHEREDEG